MLDSLALARWRDGRAAATRGDVWFQAAGSNHLPWILGLRLRGQDGLALPRTWRAESGLLGFVRDSLLNTLWSVFLDRLGVKLYIFQGSGVLPGSGGRHVAGFLPHLLRAQTQWGMDYGVEHRARTYEWEAERDAGLALGRGLPADEAQLNNERGNPHVLRCRLLP